MEKKILLTGSNGFIGKNLYYHLLERNDIKISCANRLTSHTEFKELIHESDIIFHLAGANRSKNLEVFEDVNINLTQNLCNILSDLAVTKGKKPILVFSSSTQARVDNPYGRSKLAAEKAIVSVGKENGIPTYIFRLPNVFGKWSKPNYNSVIATFCYNIIRNIPIEIHAAKPMCLVYIDDLVNYFLKFIDGEDIQKDNNGFCVVEPIYESNVNELASIIKSFENGRTKLTIDRVGVGLKRALYATYVSFLSNEKFSYGLCKNTDNRGSFLELAKTLDSGQISFFTIKAGASRGGHYHHSKTEKFIVIYGSACFRMKNLITNELVEILVDSEKPRVVETIPGWSHDIKNVGKEESIVIVWANEVFNPQKQDTYTFPLD